MRDGRTDGRSQRRTADERSDGRTGGRPIIRARQSVEHTDWWKESRMQVGEWSDGRTEGPTTEGTGGLMRGSWTVGWTVGRSVVRMDGRSDSRTEVRGRRSVHHASGGRTDGRSDVRVRQSFEWRCVRDGRKDVQRMRTDSRSVDRTCVLFGRADGRSVHWAGGRADFRISSQSPRPKQQPLCNLERLRFHRRGAPTPLWGVESCSPPSRRPNPIPATPPKVVRTSHLHGAPTTEETVKF